MACKGLSGLSALLTLFMVGILLLVVGVVTPYWQSGQGLDQGLFHVCRGLKCDALDIEKRIQYFIAVLVVLGVVIIAVTLGAALQVCVQRCQGHSTSPWIPRCVPIGSFFGTFCVVIGVIMYTTAMYEDDSPYSFGFSPWLTLASAILCGIAGFFIGFMVKGLTTQIEDINTQDIKWSETTRMDEKKYYIHSVKSKGDTLHHPNSHSNRREVDTLHMELGDEILKVKGQGSNTDRRLLGIQGKLQEPNSDEHVLIPPKGRSKSRMANSDSTSSKSIPPVKMNRTDTHTFSSPSPSKPRQHSLQAIHAVQSAQFPEPRPYEKYQEPDPEGPIDSSWIRVQ